MQARIELDGLARPQADESAQPAPVSRGHRGQAVLLGLGATLVVALALRWQVAADGWFLQDDFVTAAKASAGLTWQYLFQDYNGHLMPAGFLVVWLVTTLAPLNWDVVLGVMIVAQLLGGVVFARTLLFLFGRRPAVLVPFAVFVLSPLTLNSCSDARCR